MRSIWKEENRMISASRPLYRNVGYDQPDVTMQGLLMEKLVHQNVLWAGSNTSRNCFRREVTRMRRMTAAQSSRSSVISSGRQLPNQKWTDSRIIAYPLEVCFLLILLFSFYIMYDTKSIIRNAKQCKVSPFGPDYIREAINLFLDSLNMFSGLYHVRND